MAAAITHLRNPRIIQHLSPQLGSQNVEPLNLFRKAVISLTLPLLEGLIDNPLFFSSEMCSVCEKFAWHIPESLELLSSSSIANIATGKEASMEGLQPVWTAKSRNIDLPKGSLFQLMTRPRCPICRLVLHLLSPLSTKQFLDWAVTQPLAQLHGYRYSLHFAENRISVKTSYPGSSAFRDSGFIELLSSDFSRDPKLRPEQYSVWKSCNLSHSNWWNFSWARNFDVDFPLVRTWLRHCDDLHTRCHRSSIDSIQAIDIRLVDVADFKIVRATTQARFFALSYVWGQISMLIATAANISQLEEPNAIRAQWNRIPQTIRDAMEFVLNVGGRYLWVDSLCIVQDDVIEKHDQIAQMHKIYSTAYATIVQHSGSDARAGLPGVRKGTRSMLATEAFPRDRAMIAIADYNVPGILRNSVHSTRGWTMQEVLVSRRCLHFFDKQLTFVCAEEFVQDWRSIHLNAASHQIHRTHLSTDVVWQMNPLAETSKLDIIGKHSFEAMSLRYFQIYARVMTEYTSRQLSFESDILHAFHGLSAAIERLGAGRFFYGLSSASFDQALLWLPVSSIKRRQIVGDILIPTWSWAGWAGPSTYNCCSTKGSRSDSYSINSFVGEYYVVENGVSVAIKRSAATLFEHTSYSPYLQARLAAPPEPATIPGTTARWPQGCLHFWAEEASMDHFHCRLSPASNPSTTQNKPSLLFPLLYLSTTDQRCGVLAPSVHFVTDLTAASMNRSEHSLVLISESQNSLHNWKAYQSSRLNRLDREDIYRDFPTFLNGCTLFFDVLLIKRTGLFVERLGFGQVHPDAWLQVKRLRRYIRIV